MNNLKVLLKKIASIDIVKVFSLNAIATLVHMCTALISTKVVAGIIGPSGVALLGQLNNINSMIQGFAVGGIRNGVTKYIAEFKEEELKVSKYISNALRISAIFTFGVSFICIVGHNILSKKIMLSDSYGYVFVILGFTIFLYTLNSLLISILNGFKEFKKYVIVNITSSICSLIFSVILCLIFGLKGAMISAVTFQSVVFFVTIYLCRKCNWFNMNIIKMPIDFYIIKQYIQYTIMTLVTLSIVPVTQMLLRGYVISEISITEAGWWEGMNRISHMYLSIITTPLSVYVLPRLSELTDKWELKKELLKCYKFIIPIVLISIMVIYLLRHFIIWILYTPEFYPMEDLFLWQLLGDMFKIASWVLSFIMLAKAKTKTYIITELISGITMLLLSYIFVKEVGLVGLNIGYMLNYLLYFIIMVIIFRDILFYKKPYAAQTKNYRTSQDS